MSHVLLTEEQAQQIEVALDNVINDWVAPDDFPFEDGEMPALDGARNALATIRAARAHDQAEREPVALLQLAKDALVYHTKQTRPIQNTIDALAAIQKFKEKQR